MRKLITKIVTDDPELNVVDTAMNGLFALKKLKKHNPDVVLLDLEMPDMDGLGFLRMREELGITTPVIVISSLGSTHPEMVFATIAMGASDFIIKPSGSISLDIETLAEEIRSKIHYYHKKNVLTPTQLKEIEKEEAKRSALWLKGVEDTIQMQAREQKVIVKKHLEEKIDDITDLDLIAIGISTGGPNALRTILPEFNKDFPLPILVVQHMPPGFTAEFAKGLDDICPMQVFEAKDGMILEPSKIYIAPGNLHMCIKLSGSLLKIELEDTSPINSHKPSVEKLFQSILQTSGQNSLNIIMTGMGKDGANAITDLSKAGAICLAQSEESCVVFGMPKVAIEYGGIDEIITLRKIPDRIHHILKKLNIS